MLFFLETFECVVPVIVGAGYATYSTWMQACRKGGGGRYTLSAYVIGRTLSLHLCLPVCLYGWPG